MCLFFAYSFYFDFGLLGASGQVASFAGDGVDLVIRNIIGVILLFMPFILFTIFNNIIVIERENKKSKENINISYQPRKIYGKIL